MNRPGWLVDDSEREHVRQRVASRTSRAIARIELLTPHKPKHPLSTSQHHEILPRSLPASRHAAVFVAAITFSLYGQFHQGDQARRERFRVRGPTNDEGPAGSFERSGRKVSPGVEITEAPTGFEPHQRLRPAGSAVRGDQ
jgi:hypothetical protein